MQQKHICSCSLEVLPKREPCWKKWASAEQFHRTVFEQPSSTSRVTEHTVATAAPARDTVLNHCHLPWPQLARRLLFKYFRRFPESTLLATVVPITEVHRSTSKACLLALFYAVLLSKRSKSAESLFTSIQFHRVQ